MADQGNQTTQEPDDGGLEGSIDRLTNRVSALAESRRWFRIWGAVMAVVVAATAINSGADYLAQREADAQTRERRITSRSSDYANCQNDNEQGLAQDYALQVVYAQEIAANPGRAEALSRRLDTLRSATVVVDCSITIADLPADEAQAVLAKATARTRLPLPPPTIPGYVPRPGGS